MIKKEQLTPEAQEELNALIKGKNAFDLLVNNFYSQGESECNFRDVVARLQAQYFSGDINEEAVKTVDAWDQNEYNQPHEVNVAIPAIVPGKYSSFAIKDIHDDFEINYPLDVDYSLGGMPFINTDITETQLNVSYRQLAQKLGIKIAESQTVESSSYKNPSKFFDGAIIKIKNIFLRLAKKPELQSNIFKGNLKLQTKVDGYQVSNVEKLIKTYDLILKKSIERDAKQIKQNQKITLSKEIKYAARLFADILMTRVNDLGNIKNNQIAEQALWLQFSGVLNRYGFDSKELSQITELGSMAVANTCVNLGITKEKVIERMTRLGYTYTAIPTDISQALLKVKEKDYTRYDVEEIPEVTVIDDPHVTGIVPEFPIHTTPIDLDPTPIIEEIKKDSQTTDLIDVSTDLVDTTDNTPNIKASTVEKNIDKVVVKFVSEVGTKLAEKINNGKFKTKKTLDKATAQLNLYTLTLTYYVQSINGKPMAIKGEYTESEISKAKQLVKVLMNQKQQVAEMIASSDIKRQENQTSKAYMNAVCKQKLDYTLKDYFLNLIKGCVDYCVEQQFGKKNPTKDSDVSEDIVHLLEAAGTEDVDTEEFIADTTVLDTTDVDVDTTVLDTVDASDVVTDEETTTEEPQYPLTNYVPNFIFVDDKKDKGDDGRNN